MSKRLFDFFGAALGLVLVSPLLLGIAVWVKLDSPGPMFFRQQRVGRAGVLFRIHKFRTMVVDAPSLGPAITAGRDPRITRAGGFLRRSKLDELPQLIDVLNGDMSLVGPRPEVPEFVALYPPGIREEVLSLRPGITDEASLSFRNEADLLPAGGDARQVYIEKIMPQKLATYVEYARGRSFAGDLGILLRTLKVVLSR